MKGDQNVGTLGPQDNCRRKEEEEAFTFNVDEYLTFSNCHKINRIMAYVSEFKVLTVKNLSPGYLLPASFTDHGVLTRASLKFTL